jgi:hypothetical protein
MATYTQADRRAGSMQGQFGEKATQFQQALRPRPQPGLTTLRSRNQRESYRTGIPGFAESRS